MLHPGGQGALNFQPPGEEHGVSMITQNYIADVDQAILFDCPGVLWLHGLCYVMEVPG